LPEAILEDGRQVDVGVAEKVRPPMPAADPEKAPKGWRWDRTDKRWIPRVRGAAPEEPASPPPARSESAWVEGPDGLELGRQGDADESYLAILSDEERADVEAILELLALPVLTGVAARDPYCGGELVEAWPKIRERSLPLIARSEHLVEWLTKAGGARDWLLFAAAVRPVGTAIWRHHVTHSVELDEEGPKEEDLSRYAA